VSCLFSPSPCQIDIARNTQYVTNPLQAYGGSRALERPFTTPLSALTRAVADSETIQHIPGGCLPPLRRLRPGREQLHQIELRGRFPSVRGSNVPKAGLPVEHLVVSVPHCGLRPVSISVLRVWEEDTRHFSLCVGSVGGSLGFGSVASRACRIWRWKLKERIQVFDLCHYENGPRHLRPRRMT